MGAVVVLLLLLLLVLVIKLLLDLVGVFVGTKMISQIIHFDWSGSWLLW